MKKTLTSVLLSLILTLTASGCAPELYERLLISAIGVDRTATGCRAYKKFIHTEHGEGHF